jgi:hypothetical protein
MPPRSRSKANPLPRLQERLALNRYLCRLLGFEDFRAMREKLRTQREDWADDGHSHFYHALKGEQRLQLAPDRLADYDLRIKAYIERLNGR